ncbi:hypothetical protein RB623_15730 [Mesorhizobium sp. LHD-90]|uniref:GNAT family N-acetyltransferase n=1 Tax=Mesorhizobium sp. LHD-90 TaxID=3071414 RepID=UPI0027E11619|nr:GNAT family N-acetyltransferase [Mesorhizobium sp. LHD-90]MDQ6435508.1 hypothetical protein [Mesorhizobium sp. LHD-90]
MIETSAATRHAGLSMADLDAVYALHLAATGAVGRPELIKPESRDFFARILSGGGRITGVLRGGELIAYGVLQLELPPSEDARPLLGLSPADRLAKLAGAAVLPAAWGGGIHDELIHLRVEDARRIGVRHLYATSAPGNLRSWPNLVEAGFAVRAIVEKYGGHLRYILYRDLSAGEPDEAEGVWCGVEDIDRQRTLLAGGHAGTRWRRRADGGRDIFFRSAS